MKHIGLDVHSTTTNVNVLNDRGKSILRRQIPTQETDLIDLMRSIHGKKRVALEESQMADFVARCLEPHVQEVIRCQPQHNRLISESEEKDDAKDAENIAELLFMNKLKPVHQPSWVYRQLREGVRCYWVSSKDLARTKNRLKAFYLNNGIHCTGQKAYSRKHQKSYREKLESRSGNLNLLDIKYQALDSARVCKAAHVRELRKLSAPLKDDVARLASIPGIAFTGSCTLISYLEDGWRIPNKRKLWQYSGVSLRWRKSNNKGIEGASKRGNRYLKTVLMNAASSIAARRTADNALTQAWRAGLQAGIEPARLQRNMARTIVVLAQHLLRFKEMYRDDQVKTRH